MFDTPALSLQAAHAEILRLWTHKYIINHAKQSRKVKSRQIHGGSFVIIPTTPTHMDTEEMGQGTTWIASCLFVCIGMILILLLGVDGRSWLPFRGGIRMCPGRHFAKQQTLTALATCSTIFDINILVGDFVGMSSGQFELVILDPSLL